MPASRLHSSAVIEALELPVCQFPSSSPGLPRPSTSMASSFKKDVDPRGQGRA
jgi:hypothetical protein